MDKLEAMRVITETQDEYVSKLVELIKDSDKSTDIYKYINFNSPTGTGKTRMMAKLINLLPDYFFIITTLSKGQLHIQTRNQIHNICPCGNFIVYGTADYKINSSLQADDIIRQIPKDKKCIWLRDEGHIKTNRYDDLLLKVCYKVVNFSATLPTRDIDCNFTHTMMLRTVSQQCASPETAIKKLIEVKTQHANVKNYNPCAIFRCVSGDTQLRDLVIQLCIEHNLKYIDISTDDFIMSELCEDDNEFDVIINKFKIVEGIDIRRAHVLYMDNRPGSDATIIQSIGRCRRNALLYRDDIDIFATDNTQLLEATRQCFVYYNVEKSSINTDDDGEFISPLCDKISVEQLKPNIKIYVKNGVMDNGLTVAELIGETGYFDIITDEVAGFNVIKQEVSAYETKKYSTDSDRYIYVADGYGGDECSAIMSKWSLKNILSKIRKIRYECLKKHDIVRKTQYCFSWATGKRKPREMDAYDLPIQYIQDKVAVSGVMSCCPILREKIEDLLAYIKSLPSIEIYKGQMIDDAFNTSIIKPIQGAELDLSPIDVLKYDDLHKYIFKKYCVTFNEDPNVVARVFSSSSVNFMKKWEQHIVQKLLNPEINLCYFKGEIYNLFRNWIVFDSKTDTVHSFKQTIIRVFDKAKNLLLEIDGTVRVLEIVFDELKQDLEWLYNLIDSDTVPHAVIYSDEYEPITTEEATVIKYGGITVYDCRFIPVLEISEKYKYAPYEKITNTRMQTVVGLDSFRLIRDEENNSGLWIESKAVTSKLQSYSKLNRYICKVYADCLSSAEGLTWTGKNDFGFNKKMNACLGYCVEYFSKYLVYGESFLIKHIQMARKESQYYYGELTDYILVRACMLKYKAMMTAAFGSKVSKYIQTISVEQLVKESYSDFVRTVVTLANKVSAFVRHELYNDGVCTDSADPVLSVDHISALCDYITPDTILDVKCIGHIGMKEIKQVLAYHYLSTFRSDLNIKRVIVFDATTGRSITIDVSDVKQLV